MKRHNLLPLATVVALCMSVTSTTVPFGALNSDAQMVYAGVVKRGASSKSAGTTSAATTDASSDANTTKQETSIGTAASSDGKTYTEVDSNGQVVTQRDLQDGASKYAIPTFHGKPYSSDFHRIGGGYIEDELVFNPLINGDGSPRKLKDPVIYPVNVYKSSDWLLPNGVAKTPGYLGAELEFETASFDDRGTTDLTPTPETAAHHMMRLIYATKYTTENHPWPTINPITNKPLWDTQPFWRSDNSFDLYGYLKQFTPEYKDCRGFMQVDGSAPRKYGSRNTMYGSVFEYVHGYDDHYYINNPDDYPHGPAFMVHMQLSNSVVFQKDYDGAPAGLMFGSTYPTADGKWAYSADAQVRIEPGYEGQKIRITGTNDAYINEGVLKGLEMIMHYYVEDHSLNNALGGEYGWVNIPIPGFDVEKAKVVVFRGKS